MAGDRFIGMSGDTIAKADVVVVGEGVAGLMAALRARRAGASVVLLGLGSGASGWLQGVNVVVNGAHPLDSLATHRDDILREGCGLNLSGLVEDTVAKAPEAFQELLDLGVDFALERDQPLVRHASGSTYPRCCYVLGAMWGGKAAQALRAELKRLGVQRLRRRARRLICNDGVVCGLLAQPAQGGDLVTIAAKAVVLANGGVGNLFAGSTYPKDVFGASAALALRAGAELADMEFLQFEPLVGHAPQKIAGYVIPTTLFGDGAVVRNAKGERFLLQGRPQGEAGISKEDLVREMVSQRDAGLTLEGGGLWLDATGVDRQVIERYTWLATFFRRHGIDINRERVAVWPAAHTCLGGIRVDRARMSSVPGLFAAGEAAAGIHGAGRLAGGSGTDVLAAGWIAGQAAADYSRAMPDMRPSFDLGNVGAGPEISATGALRIDSEISRCLSDAAGIVRSSAKLQPALTKLDLMQAQLPATAPSNPASRWAETADRLLVAQAIIRAAMARQESRGAHLRCDFPATDADQARSLVVTLAAGCQTPTIRWQEV